MTALGFDKYTEPLRVYLGKFREVLLPSFCFILGWFRYDE